eukprot:SAG11_NODE_24_length_24699_cov_10.132195_5_plen_300_part_00
MRRVAVAVAKLLTLPQPEQRMALERLLTLIVVRVCPLHTTLAKNLGALASVFAAILAAQPSCQASEFELKLVLCSQLEGVAARHVPRIVAKLMFDNERLQRLCLLPGRSTAVGVQGAPPGGGAEVESGDGGRGGARTWRLVKPYTEWRRDYLGSLRAQHAVARWRRRTHPNPWQAEAAAGVLLAGPLPEWARAPGGLEPDEDWVGFERQERLLAGAYLCVVAGFGSGSLNCDGTTSSGSVVASIPPRAFCRARTQAATVEVAQGRWRPFKSGGRDSRAPRRRSSARSCRATTSKSRPAR